MSKITFDFFADVSEFNKAGFDDALPIGNGHIGAMIYGDPSTDKLLLNENTVWLGNKGRKRYSKDYYDNYKKVQNLLLNNCYKEAEDLAALGLMPNPKGQANYSAAGYLMIKHDIEEYKNYKRTLDMNNGLVTVEFDTKLSHIKRTYIASYKDDCILIKYESNNKEKLYISLDREKLIDENYTCDNSVILTFDFNKNDKLAVAATVKADSINSIGGNLIAEGNVIEIYISMATTLFVNKPVKYVLNNNKKALKSDVYANAISDYQSLYLRQLFECDNSKLKQMYDFSRYLMISSSRDNMPSNLQGMWNQDIFPVWDSKYTININIQMNYWNVFSGNLTECAKPVFKLLEKMYKNGKRVAKELYHSKGFVAHHNTDIYGDCYLQDHYLPATVWLLGGAWMSLLIYEAYEYTKDIAILNKYSHILVEAARFIADNLVEDNNEYIMCPSSSPENSFYVDGEVCHISKGCEADTQIIRDLFNAVVDISKVIKVDTNVINKINEISPKLPKTRIDSDNTIKEWYHDFAEAELGHRHISQLYGLFPSDQLSNKELKDAAFNTIKKRLEHGGGHTGWSRAWITCMYARLNQGDLALESFDDFILNSTSRVGLDLYPPFQIDGNFGIGKAILEMFVHSTSEFVEVLPALPTSINKATIKGIVVKGGEVIDLYVDNNKLEHMDIYAKTDCEKVFIYKGKKYIINLQKGNNKITLE